jgi:hypothetical protein
MHPPLHQRTKGGGVDDNDVSEMRFVVSTLFKSDDLDNNGEPPPELPLLDIPRPLIQQDAAGNNEGKEATLRPQGDINIALRRASSTVQSKKTMNLPNKNKECTSIAGAIVKLLEWQQPSLNNKCDERSAMITITIMRQMENLNKNMDDHNHWDRKQREKKCAKKCPRKRNKCGALEGVDDHGGKAGGEVGSSSCISSSNDSSSNNSSSTSSKD